MNYAKDGDFFVCHTTHELLVVDDGYHISNTTCMFINE